MKDAEKPTNKTFNDDNLNLKKQVRILENEIQNSEKKLNACTNKGCCNRHKVLIVILNKFKWLFV